MERLVKTGAGAFFAVWFALTVLNQSKRTRRFAGPIDPLSLLIPLWTFFGPSPGTTDTMVLYRTSLTPEPDTPWRLANQVMERRGLLPILYGPHRRAEKAMLDLGQVLKQVLRDDLPIDKAQLTGGYILLLRMVSNMAKAAGEHGYVQFALFDSPGYGIARREPKAIFFSLVHKLEETSGRDPG